MTGPADDLFDMHRIAARVGHDTWVERRLFEILGRWSLDADAAQVTLHFDAASRRHGWHAQLCFERLPELASLDAAALVTAPGERTEQLFDSLASAEGDAARLSALHGVVLPEVVTRHRRLIAAAPAVSAASIRRWYGFIVADDTTELLEGLDLLSDRAAEAAVEAGQVTSLRQLLAGTEQLSR